MRLGWRGIQDVVEHLCRRVTRCPYVLNDVSALNMGHVGTDNPNGD